MHAQLQVNPIPMAYSPSIDTHKKQYSNGLRTDK
jgi:hypothetical protein